MFQLAVFLPTVIAVSQIIRHYGWTFGIICAVVAFATFGAVWWAALFLTTRKGRETMRSAIEEAVFCINAAISVAIYRLIIAYAH